MTTIWVYEGPTNHFYDEEFHQLRVTVLRREDNKELVVPNIGSWTWVSGVPPGRLVPYDPLREYWNTKTE